MPALTLAILAGGHGQRLGGRDKGLLTLPDGTPLLQHILQQLEPLGWQRTLIVCRDDQQCAYDALAPKAQLITDRYGPGYGPMAGLHAALKHSTTSWVQLWPVDAPVVCPELLQALPCDMSATVPEDFEQRLQPLFGRYHVSLLPSLESHLQQNKLAFTRWVKDQQPHILPWADTRCFTNLNKPDQLFLLEQIQ